MEEFAVNDQVLVRKPIRTGTLVRMGSILKLHPGEDKALVHFPIDHTQAVIPLTNLEKTSTRFNGISRVQASPVQRHLLR